MYDFEMMEKYKNVNEFNSKIKTIEDSIYQLQVCFLLLRDQLDYI